MYSGIHVHKGLYMDMLIGPIYLFYFSISPDTNPSRKDLKLTESFKPGGKVPFEFML